MSKTGKLSSFSTTPILFHSDDSIRKSCSEREAMRNHRIQSQ